MTTTIPASGVVDLIMLQSPIILHHQQLPSSSSSLIDSRSSLQQHQHHHQHLSPTSTRSQGYCRPISPTQTTRNCRGGRGSSSEIETGVWTSTDIPAGVIFGPYDGEFTLGNGMRDHRATPYMLEVKFVDGRLISGPDAHPTRWMRFVSPSRKDHEHNLEADISPAPAPALVSGDISGFGGGRQTNTVVFRTTRTILKGEELMVWYSSRLAEKEGVPVTVNRFKGKDGYTCSRCCSNFHYPNSLKAHMRFRCYTQDTTPISDGRPPSNDIGHHGHHHHYRHFGSQDASVSSTGSAFHRVTASVSPPSDRLYVSPNNCHLVAESSHSRMDVVDRNRRRDSTGSVSSSSSSPPVNGTFMNALVLGKLGCGSGSAFRPTGKVVSLKKPAVEEKEGFRVVKSEPSVSATKMGTSMGTPISPVLIEASRRSKSEADIDEDRTKDNHGVHFSMDKVLSMPRVGHPQSPGAALAYLQVQKALEKNYGMPTYDPVVSHPGEIPAAIRALHRGPLGLDPYTGYPYRFFPPPGFPISRFPHVLPVHRPGEAFNGLPHKIPYPGFLKFPPVPEPNAAPSALLTPPPEIDMNKYAALERNLTSQAATRTFPMGDPQFAYSQNANGKNKRGHLCIYCGKLYSRKYGLKIHLRTHTGYKPLKCKVCLRPFGDPSNLNKHIRLHAEGDTPYRCDYCGKVLVRRRDLDRHIRSRHPNECNKQEEEKKTEESEIDASTSVVKDFVNEQEESEDLDISVDDDEDCEIDCVNDDSSIMHITDEEDTRQC